MMNKASDLSVQELLVAIYQQSQENNTNIGLLRGDMDEVKEQVKFTNGKVAALIEDKIRRDEREKVLKEKPSEPTTVVHAKNATVQKLDQDAVNKIMLYVGMFATAAASFVAYLVGGK